MIMQRFTAFLIMPVMVGLALATMATVKAEEPVPVLIQSKSDVGGIPGSWQKANKIFGGYLEKEGDLVTSYRLKPGQFEVVIKLRATRDVIEGGGSYQAQITTSYRQLDGKRREISVHARYNHVEASAVIWAEIHKWMIKTAKLVRRDINDYQKTLA